MRGILLALVLLAAAFSAALPVFQDAPVASACSCPDCDVVRDAEVIVAGRIVGWERASLESPFDSAHYVPISVEVRIDRVFKGTAPSTAYMIDLPSLINLKDPSRTDLPISSPGLEAPVRAGRSMKFQQVSTSSWASAERQFHGRPT